MTGYFGESTARPLVAAHRGYSARYPENTMLAYRKAHVLGVDMLEIDLHLARDGRLAMIHDGTVDRTTNGTGWVAGFTIAELQALDAGRGERIPDFEDFLAWVSTTGLLLNVEIKSKTHATVDLAVRLLEQYRMFDKCVIACFDADITEYACRQHGAKTQGFVDLDMQNFKPNSYDFLYSVGLEIGGLTPARVDEFNGRGIQPWCWCPDTRENIQKMLRCGATLCTCNELAPAMELLRRETILAGV